MNRVLLLIKGLGRGGAEQLLVSAAPYLDRSRFEYEVAYLLPWKDALVGDLHRVDVRARCLDGARGLGWVGRLRRMVKSERFDLVHAHSPYPAIGARLGLGEPRMVYTEHNVWTRYHRATYWANLLTFGRNQHVFAVSEEVRASVRYPASLGRLRMPPVETLRYGLDPATFDAIPSADGVRKDLGIPEDAPVVGMVANFKVQKGHHHLLDAAVMVRRSVPDVRFVLVGQGPLEHDIRERARRLSLDDTVVFAGFREDALRVMAAFDVFTLASTHEGLSIALLEAMAAGKPPVVTSVGGLPEVVLDRRHGLLVPPADPGALAAGLVSLLQDRSARERLGAAARRRAREFDIRGAVARSEQVYSELLS